MPKIKIYRRKFNTEGPNPRQLVAVFQSGSEVEAEECLSILQRYSTSFSTNDSDARCGLQTYRFTSEIVQPENTGGSEKEGIQVDTSAANPTKRPISYQFSWEVKHNLCQCIAWHRLYGTVRGVVEDSPAGRKLFRARVMSVWPNAEISTK